jgi:2-methylcitrate dehydratase PrpD
VPYADGSNSVDRGLLHQLVVDGIDRCERADPAELRLAAGRSLFDFLACATGGLLQGVQVSGAPEGGRTPSLLGGCSPGHAAALHAAAAHALDRDDLHWPSLTHPGSIIWAATLACAPPDSGDTLLAAVGAGYETVARVSLLLGAAHRLRWHVTTTAGTIGAAVAASLAGGATAATAAEAAGHAASVAGGTLQMLTERAGTRLFARAHAARTGVAAATAAANGVAATAHALEGPAGLVAATAEDRHSLLTASWPTVPALTQLTHRAYATNGWTQTAVEAALRLAPLPLESIRAVVVRVPAVVKLLAGGHSVDTVQASWWSLPYAVAVTLVTGTAGALERDWRQESQVRRLMSVIELAEMPAAESTYRGADIAVTDGSGRTVEAQVQAAKGDPELPLSQADLTIKWRALNPRSVEASLRDLLVLTDNLVDAAPRRLIELARAASGG